jgi:hypothetical protein
MSGNEASAIGSVRAINSGEATYASSCAGGGYAASLADLAKAPAGGTAFVSPDLTGASVIKSGYTVTIGAGAGTPTVITLAAATCNASAAAAMSDYHATSTPVTVGGTGQRSFASDSRGTIYFLNTGVIIPAGMAGASPLQ